MTQFAVKWIYVLNEDFSYNVQPYLPEDFSLGCAFEDRNGKRWLEIHSDGTAKVLKEYAWDGCTPKFALWDIVLGIPDGVPNAKTQKPKAYYASLLHDALYQFLDEGLPITRANADKIFLELLKRDDFGPRWLYFAAVRLFGGISHLFTGWKRDYNGKKLIL